MATAPTLAGTGTPAGNGQAPEEAADRIRHLEDEIADLRDTIARFADLMIGEVKDLRKAKAEAPAPPPAMVGEVVTDPTGAGPRRPWLLTELLRDAGVALRMYFDPRYRVRRSTQMLVPLIFVLFVLNGLFFRTVFTVPIVSLVLEKLGDIVLAILLYKVVSREVHRYRLALSQLVAWQQYQGHVTVIGGEPPTTPLETD